MKINRVAEARPGEVTVLCSTPLHLSPIPASGQDWMALPQHYDEEYQDGCHDASQNVTSDPLRVHRMVGGERRKETRN